MGGRAETVLTCWLGVMYAHRCMILVDLPLFKIFCDQVFFLIIYLIPK